jgi:IS30 family transposase
MCKIPWDMQTPGHFEVDLVHHCGESAVGEYIHTLQMVDAASGWSELAAIYGRSYRVMSNGFDFMQSRLPFPVLEIHPDNGTEFFNTQLIRFWGRTWPI